MRILVCGGRDYSNRHRVFAALDKFDAKHLVSLVIHGAARGADTCAAEWAARRCVHTAPFPADWKTHGRGAGPIRNQQMLDHGKPDAVVAFPGGAGTADMVRRAKAAGLPVWEVPAQLVPNSGSRIVLQTATDCPKPAVKESLTTGQPIEIQGSDGGRDRD